MAVPHRTDMLRFYYQWKIKHDTVHRHTRRCPFQRARRLFRRLPNPPSAETLWRLLHDSAFRILAVDTDSEQVVGFINAISDGVLSAYIPLLEVLPSHQKRGIGAELVRRMLDRLHHLYMIDLCCDEYLEGFYSRLGMKRTIGMITRNYHRQSGGAR